MEKFRTCQGKGGGGWQSWFRLAESLKSLCRTPGGDCASSGGMRCSFEVSSQEVRHDLDRFLPLTTQQRHHLTTSFDIRMADPQELRHSSHPSATQQRHRLTLSVAGRNPSGTILVVGLAPKHTSSRVAGSRDVMCLTIITTRKASFGLPDTRFLLRMFFYIRAQKIFEVFSLRKQSLRESLFSGLLRRRNFS